MAEIVNLPLPYLEQSSFDYNGVTQFGGDIPNIKNYNGSYMGLSGTCTGVAAGEYKIYLSLKDTSRYQWIDEDGNTFIDDIILTWKIKSIQVSKPTIDPIEYEYDRFTKMPVISGYNSNIMTQSGVGINGQYKAGEYSIVFALKDTSSCSWEDNSIEDYIITWTIKPSTFKIPVLSGEDFVYDGKSHSPVIDNYNSYVMSRSGNTASYTNAGNYYITYDLYDKDSCTWEDGSTDSKTVYWNINKQIVYVDKPYLENDQKEFVYDGTRHEPIISNYDNYMSATGTLSSVAASAENTPWKINISLKTFTNYAYLWNLENEDDKSEENQTKDIVLEWVVKKGSFSIPTILPEHSDYNGSIQEVTDMGYNSAVMKRTGSMWGIKAGTYTVVYTLLDKGSAHWEDGSTDDKEVKWYIDKITVEIPTTDKTVYEVDFSYKKSGRLYNQKNKYYYYQYYVAPNAVKLELNGVNTAIMAVDGDSNIYAGEYTATIRFINPDSCMWSDGTNESKTIDWEVVKKVETLTIPYFEPSKFAYDGVLHRPALKNDDTVNLDYWAKNVNGYSFQILREGSDISDCITQQKEIGDYTETISLLESVYISTNGGASFIQSSKLVDFQWEDGTTEPIEIVWSIEKATVSVPTISTNVFSYDGQLHSVTVVGYDSSFMSYTADSVTSASAMGEYTITFVLTNKEACQWENGSTDDITLKWYIVEKEENVEIPTVSDLEFIYNGNYHSPVIGTFDTDVILIDGVIKACDAGEYEIIFKLKNPDSCMWSDGTNENKIFKWKIHKKIVLCDKPIIEVSPAEYTYNGKSLSPSLLGFDDNKMSKEGDISAIAAGDYTLIVRLKEDTNYIYQWEDETDDDLEFQWRILTTKVSIPTVEPTLLYYGGYYIGTHWNTYYWRQPEVFGYNPDIMDSMGVTAAHAEGNNQDGVILKYYPGKYYGSYQWVIGSYTIRFSLKDPKSCTWSNGTTGDISYEWRIEREIKLLEKPYLTSDTFTYDGTEKTPEIINGSLTGLIKSGDFTKTEVGSYSIICAPYRYTAYNDIYDYRWEDGSTDEIILNWNILKGMVNIPSVTNTIFEYDGMPHLPTIIGFDSNTIEQIAESQISAGEYEITFVLKDKDSCTWNDGTIEDKSFKWSITKSIAMIPSASPQTVMYDGTYHTVGFDENEEDNSFIIAGFDPDIMMYSGSTREINVGEYELTISLKDVNSCTWSDGTIENKVLIWRITPKIVLLDKPYLADYSFVYDGLTHTPEIIHQKNLGMTIGGTTNAVKAGNYTIIISLAEDKNIIYLWGDETNDDIYLNWTIEKNKVKIPNVTNVKFPYDGESHSPTIEDYDHVHVVQSGISSAISAGEYSVVFSIKDKNSCTWLDGTTDDIVYEWKITKIIVSMPTVTDTEFLYDTTYHAPTVSEYDKNIILQDGTLGSVDAGEYFITFSLIDKLSCVWEDGTAEDVSYQWKIKKISLDKPYILNNEFVYNGGVHTPTVKNCDYALMKMTGTSNAVDAGEYSIFISLINIRNYQWKDETIDSISLDWKILRKSVDKPYLEPDNFIYDGKDHAPNIIGFKSESMLKGGDLTGCEIGKYTAIVSLNINYEWTDGSIDDISLSWGISEILVNIPNITDTNFIYDAMLHSPIIEEYDVNTVSMIGTASAIDAGDYVITFGLKDKEHSLWEDYTSEDISFSWQIQKQSLLKPFATNTYFVYNGGLNLPTINNFDSDTMNVNGITSEVNAGYYFIYVSIKDLNNYQWDDGTNDTLTFPWEIGRKIVETPYLEPDTFVYNTLYQSPEIINFDEKIMEIVPGISTVEACDVGEYQIVILLGEKKSNGNGEYYYIRNYQWENGTIDDIILKWNITPMYIKYPTISDTSFVYDTYPHSPTLNGFNSDFMMISGTLSEINAGDYKIGFRLQDIHNYQWEDNTVDGDQYSWKILKAKLSKNIDKPVQEPILIYNGVYQMPTWNNYDTDKFKEGNVISKRNAGKYTAGFYLTDNYIWEDGSTDPLEVPWIIAKLGVEDPVQINTLYYNRTEQSPEWGIDRAAIVIFKFTGDTTGVNAGEYNVVCICDENCYFLSTDTDTCFVSWAINKKPLDAPYVKEKYCYTGESISPEFENYDPYALHVSGDLSEVDIGSYVVYFEIKDTSNYVWADDVVLDNMGKVNASWEIISSAKTAEVPYQSNYLIYNGEKQSPTWNNYNTNAMIIMGGTPAKIKADIYYAVFRLKNGYVWSDDTTEDKLIPWSIDKKKVVRPYIRGTENDGTGVYYFEIEGKRYPVWVNYESDIMKMSGETYDIDNSWHTTYFNLKDTDNYIWDNGLSDEYSVTWKLTEIYKPNVSGEGGQRVHIPRQINAPYEDGTVKYPQWDGFNTTAIRKIGGEWDGVESGIYYVLLELEIGYIWEDGTTEIKTVSWSILNTGESQPEYNLLPLHIPNQINPPSYDGFVKQPEWDEWDGYGIDVVAGSLYGVLSGTYVITLRPQTGYVWEDGTVEDKVITWVINPREEEPVVVPEKPRQPEPEVEESTEGNMGGCCCCNTCCPDTGLFDKLNNYEFDDGIGCDCSSNKSDHNI